MSEYIGSRIALISKSDIKYIGTLHEIDSTSHTVALESVKSYGTEGRKGNPAEEVPGSDQVYEYINFRGSDVKELTIVSPPGEAKENRVPPQMPDDPAILGSARPVPQNQQQPQQQPNQQNQQQYRGPPPPYQPHPQFGYQGPPPPNQFQNQPRFQGPGGPHGFPGSPGAVPGYGMGYPPPPPGYGMPFNGPPLPGHGFPGQPHPGQFNPNQQMPIGPPGQQMNQQRPPPQMQGQQQAPIGSNKSTPQPQASQAPPPQQMQPKPIEMSATPGPNLDAPAGPPPPVESKPSVTAATAPPVATQASKQPANPVQKAANSRVAIPIVSGQRQPPKSAATPSGAGTRAPPPSRQQQDIADATQTATAAVAAAMAKLGTPGQNQGVPQADTSTDNLAQKVNQMRLQDNQQRGRGNSRGRGGPPRGGRRESAQAIEVPKEDYDFESANAKFNKQDLVKESIASGSPTLASPAANGDTHDPMAPTNGHMNGADGDEDVVIPPSASDKSYDKKSSFFDNISSDLKDRTEQQGQGVDGRAMRAQERTKNMDTFGQSNVDGGYRGGHRGRGRGRGFGDHFRGRGGAGGGGFHRGGSGRPYDNNVGGGPRGGFRGNRGDAPAAAATVPTAPPSQFV